MDEVAETETIVVANVDCGLGDGARFGNESDLARE